MLIMKIETIEEASIRIFPHHKGLTILASNKIMLRRAAFIKGVKWYQEMLNNEQPKQKQFDIKEIEKL